jgi:hypothetical protein
LQLSDEKTWVGKVGDGHHQELTLNEVGKDERRLDSSLLQKPYSPEKPLKPEDSRDRSLHLKYASQVLDRTKMRKR